MHRTPPRRAHRPLRTRPTRTNAPLGAFAAPALIPLCLFIACADGEDDIPPAPARGGTPTAPPSIAPDAGADPEQDAGEDDDAGLEPGTETGTETGDCDTITPVTIPLGEAIQSGSLGNTASSPEDFEVGRVEHVFADCTRRTLELRFGKGVCTRPRSPELRIEFSAVEIEAGRLRRGQIPVRSDRSPAAAGLSIRFRRTTGSDAGEWGSCGIPSGTIDLRTTPRLERGAVYTGSYDMSLPPCDGTNAQPVILQGTFNVALSLGIEEACGEAPKP